MHEGWRRLRAYRCALGDGETIAEGLAATVADAHRNAHRYGVTVQDATLRRGRRRGRTLVAAKQPAMWEAGFTLASRLREADNRESTGVHLRAHVGRAHWRLYWSGDGRQTPVVRWMHLVLVHGRPDRLTFQRGDA